MFFDFGAKVYYEYYSGSLPTVVLMHGWGCDHKAFAALTARCRLLGMSVLTLDFPGFGSSDMPSPDWGIIDYADMVAALMTSLGIELPVLVGHSFGGRVAVILASRALASKVVLVDSAGLKPLRGLIYRFKVAEYKLRKRLGMSTDKCGSDDYRALDVNMRRVFSRVVGRYLEDEARMIQVPTLIYWGRSDRSTPMYMARRFKKLIPSAQLVVAEGGHFAYLYHADAFSSAVIEFVRKQD